MPAHSMATTVPVPWLFRIGPRKRRASLRRPPAMRDPPGLRSLAPRPNLLSEGLSRDITDPEFSGYALAVVRLSRHMNDREGLRRQRL